MLMMGMVSSYGTFSVSISKLVDDIGSNIHVHVDISMFSSYYGLQGSSILTGNGIHASVSGVGMIDLKFTSRGRSLLVFLMVE